MFALYRAGTFLLAFFSFTAAYGQQVAQPPSQTFALTANCTLRFADVRLATQMLTKQDDFLKNMSQFDRQCRLQSAGAVTEQQYLDFLTDNIRLWDPAEVKHIIEGLENVKKWIKDQDLRIPFPKEIVLIKTSGDEEGNAAYCRSHAIVLPQQMVRWKNDKLSRLLAHELFHVLSSQTPPLRTKLYAIIGFRVGKPIELPEPLNSRKLTNPDGPSPNCYVDLKIDQQTVTVVPLLCGKRPYDDKKKGSLFDYLEFRLLAVSANESGWSAKLKDGKPVLLTPGDAPSYFERIGRNTNYIIHPDEVLADNFVHLLTQKSKLPNPEITQSMRKLFIE